MPVIGPIIAAIVALQAWFRVLTPLVKIPLKIALLVAAFLVIPVPEWASTLPTKLTGLPETVQYMLYLTQLGFGLIALASAYLLRLAWSVVSGAIKGS